MLSSKLVVNYHLSEWTNWCTTLWPGWEVTTPPPCVWLVRKVRKCWGTWEPLGTEREPRRPRRRKSWGFSCSLVFSTFTDRLHIYIWKELSNTLAATTDTLWLCLQASLDWNNFGRDVHRQPVPSIKNTSEVTSGSWQTRHKCVTKRDWKWSINSSNLCSHEKSVSWE